MTEKSITMFTPCCGKKFTLYYEDVEPAVEFEPHEPERHALPAPRQRRTFRETTDGMTTKEKQKFYRDHETEEQREKRREYQRRWFAKQKLKQEVLAKEARRQHRMNQAHEDRKGHIKNGSMADSIQKYLATHADKHFKASEIGHEVNLPNKRVTAVLSQMLQRGLVIRRESEYGAWEYTIPK